MKKLIVSGGILVFLLASLCSAQINTGGGGGSGTVTTTGSPANTYCAFFSAATSITGTASLTCDASGNLIAVSLATSGNNGGLSGVEGTGASLTAGAGTDLLYPDSTKHCYHANFNNVDLGCLSGTVNAPIEYSFACGSGTVSSGVTHAIGPFGANMSSSCVGNPVSGSGMNPSHTCTLQNFTAKTSAGGKDGTDMVFSVLKNGSPSGITCTLGTATSCVDTTHSVSVTSTDRIIVQYITEASSTAANPGFAMQCL